MFVSPSDPSVSSQHKPWNISGDLKIILMTSKLTADGITKCKILKYLTFGSELDINLESFNSKNKMYWFLLLSDHEW